MTTTCGQCPHFRPIESGRGACRINSEHRRSHWAPSESCARHIRDRYDAELANLAFEADPLCKNLWYVYTGRRFHGKVLPERKLGSLVHDGPSGWRAIDDRGQTIARGQVLAFDAIQALLERRRAEEAAIAGQREAFTRDALGGAIDATGAWR